MSQLHRFTFSNSSLSKSISNSVILCAYSKTQAWIDDRGQRFIHSSTAYLEGVPLSGDDLGQASLAGPVVLEQGQHRVRQQGPEEVRPGLINILELPKFDTRV